MDQFKVGDVVRLRSGSSPMTVESLGSNGTCCVWFQDFAVTETGRVMYSSDLQRKTFPIETLVKDK